jgi:hypothetical protein
MTRQHAMIVALVAGTSMAVGGPARADDPPSTTPQPTPAAGPTSDPDADALRGPSLNRHPDRPERSIVRRDFQGRLKKLDENPAMAALGVLRLSPEEKQRVDKIVGDRAAALDTIVRDNLRLIIELAQAKQSGESESTRRLQAQVLEKASPFFKRGPLLGEVRPALTDEHFAELKRMVDEYNAVAADDRMGDPMTGPKKDNKLGALLAQGFEGFAAEARASYERVVGAGGKEFEALIRMLSLTSEQESGIRQKAGDLFQKTYGKPTKRQQFQLFMDIYAQLDVEQRHKLADYIGEENRVKRSAAKKP